MDLLFILFLVMVAVSFVNLAVKNLTERHKLETTTVNKEKACPPHKWDYAESGKMYCTTCFHFAGTFNTNNGEY